MNADTPDFYPLRVKWLKTFSFWAILRLVRVLNIKKRKLHHHSGLNSHKKNPIRLVNENEASLTAEDINLLAKESSAHTAHKWYLHCSFRKRRRRFLKRCTHAISVRQLTASHTPNKSRFINFHPNCKTPGLACKWQHAAQKRASCKTHSQTTPNANFLIYFLTRILLSFSSGTARERDHYGSSQMILITNRATASDLRLWHSIRAQCNTRLVLIFYLARALTASRRCVIIAHAD
jgi:hypothetical protein